MKVVDYLKEKGLLFNKKQSQIELIWRLTFIFFALCFLSLGLTDMLYLFGSFGLNIVTLTKAEYWGILAGSIVAGIATYIAMLQGKKFSYKMGLGRLYKTNPEKFEVEMRNTTAEIFENELRSIYMKKYVTEKQFKDFINKIKLYEWEWGTPENNL